MIKKKNYYIFVLEERVLCYREQYYKFKSVSWLKNVFFLEFLVGVWYYSYVYFILKNQICQLCF